MRKTLSMVLAEKISTEGLTQKTAAERMGTEKENVNRWLNDVEPTGQWIEPLMRFLGITFDELAVLVLATKQEKAQRKAARA